MSLAVPTFLDRPRWSTVSKLPSGSVSPAGLAASIAGLPASRRWVLVGPPLSASGPSFASWPRILPVVTPLMVADDVFCIRL